MQLAASIAFILAGTACAFLCIWHEYRWRQRKNWTRTTGLIIDYEENSSSDGFTYSPIIEYQSTSGSSQFISKYGSSRKPKVGNQTTIILSKDEREAEEYSFSNRWIFTFVPIPFAFIFITIGISMLKN